MQKVKQHLTKRYIYCTYRQRKTTESTKFINDQARKHWPLRNLALATLMEGFMGVQRRVMLGSMADPTASFLAILLTALIEAMLRCTVHQRDELWDRITNARDLTKEEKQCKKIIQSAYTANCMHIEVTSIISSR